MGKCRRPSIDIIRKWINRGDGQGTGRHYQPFFKVRDIPSSGRSRMILGLKTGRVHHYLSDIEYHYHLLAEYEPSVVDIRERYALLPWQETLDIADELGIKHPTYPGTRTPVVMTSDLVITTMQSKIRSVGVICVQPSSTLDPANVKCWRVLEKLLIEKSYWERRAIPWQIATEQDLPRTRVKNLDLLRTSMMSKELDWLNQRLNLFIELFMDQWTYDKPLLTILRHVANQLALEIEYTFTLFGRAVWLRLLPVDIDTEIIHHHKRLQRYALKR